MLTFVIYSHDGVVCCAYNIADIRDSELHIIYVYASNKSMKDGVTYTIHLVFLESIFLLVYLCMHVCMVNKNIKNIYCYYKWKFLLDTTSTNWAVQMRINQCYKVKFHFFIFKNKDTDCVISPDILYWVGRFNAIFLAFILGLYSKDLI